MLPAEPRYWSQAPRFGVTRVVRTFARKNRRVGERDQPSLLSGVGALNGVGVLQSGSAGLQQGLEVGQDLRPAARHRLDEF